MKVRQGTLDAETGEIIDTTLYTTEDGVEIEGEKAHINLSGGISVDLRKTGIFIKLSLPRYIHGVNTQPVRPANLPDAFERLQEGLSADGIEADVMGASLSRLDLFRDVRLSAPPAAYNGLLRSLRFPKLSAREYQEDTLTHYWRGGGRCLTVYDKSAEASLSVPGIQRFEYRLENVRSVKRHLGLATTRDLCCNYAAAEKTFLGAFEELFAGYPESSSEHCSEGRLTADHRGGKRAEGLNAQGLNAEKAWAWNSDRVDTGYEALIEKAVQSNSHYMNKILGALAIGYLEKRGDVKRFERALMSRTDRKAVHRFRKKLPRWCELAAEVSSRVRRQIELLSELREKVLASPRSTLGAPGPGVSRILNPAGDPRA